MLILMNFVKLMPKRLGKIKKQERINRRESMYVELKNINKMYNDYKASNDINLGIKKGKLVALLGPSGSGKSTILRMIAGLETPDSGEIVIDGKVVNDVSPSKRGIGFVFQNYALFRYMTVFDNIAFGLKIAKEKKSVIKERVEKLMELVNIKGLGKRYPNQLSGGQRQRVAFARALAPNPEILLLDEPFSALDSYLKERLVIELKETLARFQKDVVLVTHSRDEAYQLCDRIAVLSAGKLEVFGKTHAVFTRPQTVTAAVLTGCKNIADAEKRGSHDVFVPSWNVVLHTEDEVQDGLCAVGVRAHSFSSQRNENEQPIVVTECVEQPFEWVIKFRYANQCVNSEDLWWRFPKEHFPSSMPSQLGIRREDVLPLNK